MSMTLPGQNQSVYAPAQALLTMLQERLSGEVAAIHAAALEMLSGQHGTVANAVRVSMTVEPQTTPEADQEVVAANRSTTCWDHTYACGKSETGYIMCTVHICMYT
jgi:hypothetical protein